jgi:hypothetical protein
MSRRAHRPFVGRQHLHSRAHEIGGPRRLSVRKMGRVSELMPVISPHPFQARFYALVLPPYFDQQQF